MFSEGLYVPLNRNTCIDRRIYQATRDCCLYQFSSYNRHTSVSI